MSDTKSLKCFGKKMKTTDEEKFMRNLRKIRHLVESTNRTKAVVFPTTRSFECGPTGRLHSVEQLFACHNLEQNQKP